MRKNAGQICVYKACFCLGLSLIAAVASAQEPETTPTPSPPSPPFTLFPEDQDWSMMRDPALRRDWSDKIKYIPLGQREDWYLSIGGEARPWYERYRNGLICSATGNWSNRTSSKLLHVNLGLAPQALCLRLLWQAKKYHSISTFCVKPIQTQN